MGAVAGSATENTLRRLLIDFAGYPYAKDGLQAVRDGKVDAFVKDRPLLAWTINQDFRSSIQLLDVIFDQLHYAFALPAGSPLRKPVSVALLKEVRSPWWGDAVHRYLGWQRAVIRRSRLRQILLFCGHGGLNRVQL